MQSDRSYASWLDVYQAHKRQLFLVALAITRRPELAEDAVHDAFANLYARHGGVRNAKTYAYQAVRNSARMIIRSRYRAGEPADAETLPCDLSTAIDPVGRHAEQSEAGEVVRRVLLELSEDQREVIVMHIHADLKFHEIAAILERPPGTVASQYRRGIERIRELLPRSWCHD